MRDPELNINNNDYNKDFEQKYLQRLKILLYMMVALSICRLFSLEILGMFTDAIGSLMIYMYIINRGKCMAIFLCINSVMGLFVGFSKSYQLYYISISNNNLGLFNFLFIVSIYALIVYFFEFYISVVGINKYSWENLLGIGQNNQNTNTYSNNIYGAISQNDNTNNNNNNRGYVPFGGPGHRLNE